MLKLSIRNEFYGAKIENLSRSPWRINADVRKRKSALLITCSMRNQINVICSAGVSLSVPFIIFASCAKAIN